MPSPLYEIDYFLKLPLELQWILNSIQSTRSPDSLSNEFLDDSHTWKSAAKQLHISGKAPLNIKINEGKEALDFYRNAIDLYYKTINNAFFTQLNIAKKQLEGLDYDFKTFEDHLPKFQEEEILSNVQYNQILREFIRAHKKDEILSEILFQATNSEDNFLLIKMLLEEKVTPDLVELPIKANTDLQSLSWVTLITSNPNYFTNIDFFKTAFKYSQIDQQGLTYILWLMCQNSEEGHEDNEIEVMKFLLSQGATWDAKSLADYPPILLSEDDFLPSFTYENNNKKKVFEFVLKAAALE